MVVMSLMMASGAASDVVELRGLRELLSFIGLVLTLGRSAIFTTSLRLAVLLCFFADDSTLDSALDAIISKDEKELAQDDQALARVKSIVGEDASAGDPRPSLQRPLHYVYHLHYEKNSWGLEAAVLLRHTCSQPFLHCFVFRSFASLVQVYRGHELYRRHLHGNSPVKKVVLR